MHEHRPEDPTERRADRTAEEAAGNAPLGGDANTAQQLDADNEVEEDSLKSLDPDDSPA